MTLNQKIFLGILRVTFSNLEIFVRRLFADIVDEDLPAGFAVAERFVAWGPKGLVAVASVAALPVGLGRRLVLVVSGCMVMTRAPCR